MNWKERLAENPQGCGDPVTALWQPNGYVIASSFPLVRVALGWVARLAFGDRAQIAIERSTTTREIFRSFMTCS